MIRRLIILLLIVGCEDTTAPEDSLGNCVLYDSYFTGVKIVTWFYCYEDIYTKKECMDKADTSDKNYSIYLNSSSCSDYCDGKAEPQYCKEY